MSDDLGFPHDHGNIAWNYFLAQHAGRHRTEEFVQSFYKPLNILDRILNDLYTRRWIETAFSDALDKAGTIVGQSRYIEEVVYLAFFGFVSQPAGRAFGIARIRKRDEAYAGTLRLGDEEYRMALKAKIALNNSHGTAEEIMFIISYMLGGVVTHLHDIGNATAELYVHELITPNDPRFWIVNAFVPKAAGVKLYVMLVHGEFIFGFEGKGDFYGFGVGRLARRPGSQHSFTDWFRMRREARYGIAN